MKEGSSEVKAGLRGRVSWGKALAERESGVVVEGRAGQESFARSQQNTPEWGGKLGVNMLALRQDSSLTDKLGQSTHGLR